MAKKLKPIHSGEHLREDFMNPLGLSSDGLARALGVTALLINEIIRERRGITADTALRLARYFRTDAQSWLNLQSHYDLQCAQDDVGPTLTRIRPFKKKRETATTTH